MQLQKDHPFSTSDKDNDDNLSLNCAATRKGGFWFANCGTSFPTSKYYVGGTYTGTIADGISYSTWPAHPTAFYSMKTMEYKFRPYLL